MVALDRDGGTVFEPRLVQVAEWVDLPAGDGHIHAWVVDHGLAVGDRVIVDNLVVLGRMPPGLPVKIVPAAASTVPVHQGKGK